VAAIPAVVLTAGLATRLRPLSLIRAKAALPLAGRPLVWLILEQLRDAGVTDAVLNLHHLPHTLTSRIGDGSALGLPVRYSWETTVLGSAGGPRRAVPLVDGPTCFVVNGDTLCSVDFSGLLAAHRRSGAVVTMATTANHEPHKYGGVVATADGEVTGFAPPGSTTPSQHFVGVQVVETAAYADVPPDTPWASIATLYPALLAARPGSIRTFPAGDTFHDIGTPLDYIRTALEFGGNGAAPAHGDDGARVVDSVLWDGVTLGRGASLTRCVVTDDVVVPAGATFSHAILRRADGPPATNGEVRHGDLFVSTLEPGARSLEPTRR
jgi:mannose-1-phosphate guanylyltransferase